MPTHAPNAIYQNLVDADQNVIFAMNRNRVDATQNAIVAINRNRVDATQNAIFVINRNRVDVLLIIVLVGMLRITIIENALHAKNPIQQNGS